MTPDRSNDSGDPASQCSAETDLGLRTPDIRPFRQSNNPVTSSGKTMIRISPMIWITMNGMTPL